MKQIKIEKSDQGFRLIGEFVDGEFRSAVGALPTVADAWSACVRAVLHAGDHGYAIVPEADGDAAPVAAQAAAEIEAIRAALGRDPTSQIEAASVLASFRASFGDGGAGYLVALGEYVAESRRSPEDAGRLSRALEENTAEGSVLRAANDAIFARIVESHLAFIV